MPPSLSRFAPYTPRPIRFLRVAEIGGWHLKVYGISARQERPERDAVEAALRLAAEQLPRPATSVGGDAEPSVSHERYGVGVLIVHEGREGLFVLMSWWAGENMLQHRVFLAPEGPPFAFEDPAPTRVIACVWELAVLAFERDAWVETVLANPTGPDLQAYLARHLATDR
jgi:hypothetical protein